jgi:hypothetical protein
MEANSAIKMYDYSSDKKSEEVGQTNAYGSVENLRVGRIEQRTAAFDRGVVTKLIGNDTVAMEGEIMGMSGDQSAKMYQRETFIKDGFVYDKDSVGHGWLKYEANEIEWRKYDPLMISLRIINNTQSEILSSDGILTITTHPSSESILREFYYTVNMTDFGNFTIENSSIRLTVEVTTARIKKSEISFSYKQEMSNDRANVTASGKYLYVVQFSPRDSPITVSLTPEQLSGRDITAIRNS